MRQVTLSTALYPTKAKARLALEAKVLSINGAKVYMAHSEPTFGVVIERFLQEERIPEILAQQPGDVTLTEGLAFSTASVYSSFLNKHIRPRWAGTNVSQIKPLEVADWLKSLALAAKSKKHIKALLQLLLDKAMLWGLMETDRNPIGLVKVKGGSRRTKVPTVLTPNEFQALVALLPETYRVMATVAMCTGLRISEVLALRWKNLDFNLGILSVEQGVYAGRVGDTKTEASRDVLPLTGAFAEILREWKEKGSLSESELVFPSPVTGRCYHAGGLMTKYIKPAGVKIGLLAVGWHSFRHTYRGLLDDTGANTGTQKGLMRHSNVSTTMNVYGRASMKAKQEANSKVVQMILPPKGLCA